MAKQSTTKAPAKAKPKAKPSAPLRPKGLAFGRWLGDLEAERPLSDAERALVACCAKGLAWEPEGWDGKRPEKENNDNAVRGALIAALMLDFEGNDLSGEIRISGAWIYGDLNFDRLSTHHRVVFYSCHFCNVISLMYAKIFSMTFSKSLINGINGEGLRVDNGFEIIDNSISNAQVDLEQCHIMGHLNFKESIFKCMNGFSIFLAGANIRIGIGLVDSSISGGVCLIAAKVGTLFDDTECWKGGGHAFDGFRYDRVLGETDASSRIAWLRLQVDEQLCEKFAPQPWEQLIKVLRDMGHGFEAGEVAIAKQEQMRVAGKIKGPIRLGLHWLYGELAGYGHRPIRTVTAMLITWLACAFFFQIGGSYGYMGPNTPLLSSPALAKKINDECGNRRDAGKTVWTQCGEMPPEYTTFQPLAYSADLILPLVNLQQEEDWAPIVSVPSGANMGFGVFLRLLMWFEILFGWAMSLMLVAVLGRLVEKD